MSEECFAERGTESLRVAGEREREGWKEAGGSRERGRAMSSLSGSPRREAL